MAAAQCVECHGTRICIRNTFVYACDSSRCSFAGEDEQSPAMIRAKTLPSAAFADIFAEVRAATSGERKRTRFCLDSDEAVYSDETAEPDSAGEVETDEDEREGLVPRTPAAMIRSVTRDFFEERDEAFAVDAPWGWTRASVEACGGGVAASMWAVGMGWQQQGFLGDAGADEQPPAPASAGRPGAASSAGVAEVEEFRTTLMFRNMPNNYSRADLLELLDALGFYGKYDLVYFPIDFRTHAAMGYAFVNLVTPRDAVALRNSIQGFSRWSIPSRKVCVATWSDAIQGFEANVARYRNSPLMHEAVPDSYRPAVFSGGVRVPFPPPTKRVKPPRQGTERILL